MKNVYRYRMCGAVSSYIDVFGHLYLFNWGVNRHIFGQSFRDWTKIFVKHSVEDFIYGTPHLLLTPDHELHVIGTNPLVISDVKKIGCLRCYHGMPKINYFLTFDGQLYVIDDTQNKRIATNVTHVLEATYHGYMGVYSSDQLYYVIQSSQVWRYFSDTCESIFELELNDITFLHNDLNSLYINDVCYLDTGKSLTKIDKHVPQKGLMYQYYIVIHDEVNKTLTFKDHKNVIHHIDDNISQVFIEREVLYYIKKKSRSCYC